MAESYFSHLAHEEVSQAMLRRERKRKMAAAVDDDSNSKKTKLENEQSVYNDFSHRMMVRLNGIIVLMLVVIQWSLSMLGKIPNFHIDFYINLR